MKELLKKWQVELDVDSLVTNPDPYTLYLDIKDIVDASTRLSLEYNKLKLKEKIITSQLYIKFKQSNEKVTEKNIECLINSSVEVLELREQLIELETLLEYLEGIAKVLEVKSILMNSLLADRRKGLTET